MDELRQHILDLQNNQKALAAFNNDMQKVINCHSENMEGLKNYTLKLSDRVKDLENGSKLDKDDKEHSEEITAVKNELANLELKMDSVTEVIKDTNVRYGKEISVLNKEHKQETNKIKELLEENLKKTKEVEGRIKIQKENIKKTKVKLRCEECGEFLNTKLELRSHVKTEHQKTFCCDICDVVFNESWKLETHLETHSNKIKEHKCEVCGKEFFLLWRFKQHMNVHQNPNVLTCRYNKHNKVCPYDQVGCKFKHVNQQSVRNQTVKANSDIH